MPLKKRLSWSGIIMPIRPDRLVRRPLACRLTVNACFAASALMRCAVSSAIRALALPLSTALTVDADTSASLARS